MTTPTTVNVRLQLRADTAANWTAANPTLLVNEVGLETDTKKLKVGNGSTAWNSLGYFPSIVSGGTVLGNLEIGSTGTLTFEGSTADGFETTLAVTNPTADRTITLPNQSGTVVVSGNASIVDADIAANAEIAVSKLADGAARQLLQTDAAGTGVEWTSNVDIPGTLDVTGAATFDGAVGVGTSAPGSELEIADTSGYVEQRFRKGAGANDWAYIGLGSTSFSFETRDATPIYFATNAATRAVIDSSGRVGIGSTSPQALLHVEGGTENAIIGSSARKLYFRADSGGVALGTGSGQTGNGFYFSEASNFIYAQTNTTERARIDSSGRLLVGTSTSRGNNFNLTGQNMRLQVEGTDYLQSGASFTSNSNTAGEGPHIAINRSRGTTVGSNTVVQDGDRLGLIAFQGNDGAEFVIGASIDCLVDGTPGANDMPGRLVFFTTPDGDSSPDKRMQIDSGSNTIFYGTGEIETARFTGARNLLIGGTLNPTSATNSIGIVNGTAPTASITDGVVLYAQDVSASSELRVRDEAGNVTTLSPHNFELIPEGPSEDMAWSYYSERDGKRINVDMLKAIRLLEQLTGEKLVFTA